MASPEEPEAAAAVEDVGDEPEETPGYKPPAQKTLDEIQQLDADDESLVRYKQALLGGTGEAPKERSGPNVVVEKLSMLPVDGEPKSMDLTGDLSKLKSDPIVIKEGCSYKIEIQFKVNYEIVAGLRYHQKTTRKGITVDKTSHMVGSYGPKAESYQFLTPVEEAPKGMLARGSYKVKSRFVDDDKNIYKEWEWAMDIKKDWK
ncbi:rho GDP-dissociation inhibitor 1-like [Oscarella lobularis]|uniref:rho GDP-dissociation inhibitor 1-like n=1 Tax=Oscarella lobularis TaxID=121494 RepID=UPI0033131ED8